MKYTILFLIIGYVLSGCAPLSPVQGIYYTGTKAPQGDKVKISEDAQPKSMGESACHSVLFLVAWGDCSIKEAMRDGNITKIHHVDQFSMNILYIYFRYETNVWGEQANTCLLTTITFQTMTLSILSTQSKVIKKFVKESMRQEAQEIGFDPYGDTGQAEFERRVMELEQKSLDHPEIDWEVKFWELSGHG